MNDSAQSAQQKTYHKSFYNKVNRQLSDDSDNFMNLGYLAGPMDHATEASSPKTDSSLRSARLATELFGDYDFNERTVLEVGCGRGGVVRMILDDYRPASIVGLDISTNAIAYCKAVHRGARASFHEGDAERLPFANSSFDVVVNLESSHLYPDIESFYREVYRVLSVGGRFLYGDALPRRKSEYCFEYLQRLGFKIETRRDISRNVLFSMESSRKGRQVFQGPIEQIFTRAYPEIVEALREGSMVFHLARLRK